MTVLARLLNRVGAYNLLLSRGENTDIRPMMYAKLDFDSPASKTTLPVLILAKMNNGTLKPFKFGIDWDIMHKCLSRYTIKGIERGYDNINVYNMPRSFQYDVVRRICRNLDGETQLIYHKNGKINVFIPAVKSYEELVIWLDLNESGDILDDAG